MISALLVSFLLTTSIPADNIALMNGTITDNTNNIVEVTTMDGNGWLLKDRTDLKINDNIIVVFDTKGTSNIEDDEIINTVKIEIE